MSELAHSISFIDEGVAKRPNVYGDLVLTPKQEKLLILDHELSLEQVFPGSDLSKLPIAIKWPNAELPYEIASTFDSILSELENLLKLMCLRWHWQ